MRTIRDLSNQGKRVYIYLRTEKIRQCFIDDATKEGITFGDGVSIAERGIDDIMALNADGTVNFLCWGGRMMWQCGGEQIIRVDYERYVDGDGDYLIKL